MVKIALQLCSFVLVTITIASWQLDWIIVIRAASVNGAAAVDCMNQTCGSIHGIRYPFRVKSNVACSSYDNHYFDLDCITEKQGSNLYMLYNHTARNISLYYKSPEYTRLLVKQILISDGSLIVDNTALNATLGFNTSGGGGCSQLWVPSPTYLQLPPVTDGGPFVLAKENNLGAFGCAEGQIYVSDFGYVNGSLQTTQGQDTGGCSVVLPDDQSNTACGNGTCCIYDLSVTTLVSGIRYAPFWIEQSISLSANYLSSDFCSKDCNRTFANLFHPNYTAIADLSYFNNPESDYTEFRSKIDWSIPLFPNQTGSLNSSDLVEWEKAVRGLPDFACTPYNSRVVPVDSVPGYLCSCADGFLGNPYLNGSCTDINECEDASNNQCIKNQTICVNNEGGYMCICSAKLHVGDGKMNGSGCRFSPTAIQAFSITSGIFLLLFTLCTIFQTIRWQTRREKRRNFELNGGFLLKAYMERQGLDTTRLFTIEELRRATNNFSSAMKIGAGGFGVVYKGVLKDGKTIAIKLANKYEERMNEQFTNEIIILLQINHKHIVKLLGCCLEAYTPHLVYEYVPNGNLETKIHEKGDGCVMPWERRLIVSRQIAEALEYLHSYASPPIIHRDVKPSNVLLDNNWDAKVADFGVSRLFPEGVDHVTTCVQGTLGYLDPEYFEKLQLTHKSDVYSLGVLLIELITSLKPIHTHNQETQFSNLILQFTHHMEQGTIEELIDPELYSLVDDIDNNILVNIKSSILLVASLAYDCISHYGDDRPSMSHVASVLKSIYSSYFL